jgi:hypothetical protein
MMNDPFLEALDVKTEESAMRNAIQSALQHNKTYRDGVGDPKRKQFRTEWATFIRNESIRYTQPVSDVQHCESITRISDGLSSKFGGYLINGRLRYGTSQKAFNLHLKFLWRMGKAATPPHCPVDGIMLKEAGINEKWTKCDAKEEYMNWVTALRVKASPRSLAEWEYDVWYQDWLRRRASRE